MNKREWMWPLPPPAYTTLRLGLGIGLKKSKFRDIWDVMRDSTWKEISRGCQKRRSELGWDFEAAKQVGLVRVLVRERYLYSFSCSV